jgi:hypothetical protein
MGERSNEYRETLPQGKILRVNPALQNTLTTLSIRQVKRFLEALHP